ncbi:MAG: NAD-dependent epimerase/dehydratase family protein [Terriglobales bacterium]
MRALVIGGTGFIGAHVARQLAQAGHRVLLFHNGEESTPTAEERLTHLPASAVPADNSTRFDSRRLGEAPSASGRPLPTVPPQHALLHAGDPAEVQPQRPAGAS